MAKQEQRSESEKGVKIPTNGVTPLRRAEVDGQGVQYLITALRLRPVQLSSEELKSRWKRSRVAKFTVTSSNINR